MDSEIAAQAIGEVLDEVNDRVDVNREVHPVLIAALVKAFDKGVAAGSVEAIAQLIEQGFDIVWHPDEEENFDAILRYVMEAYDEDDE